MTGSDGGRLDGRVRCDSSVVANWSTRFPVRAGVVNAVSLYVESGQETFRLA
jgi:hypothetical protein